MLVIFFRGPVKKQKGTGKMKKFLLMFGAVALMTACSDEETGGGSGSGSINYEEGYKNTFRA